MLNYRIKILLCAGIAIFGLGCRVGPTVSGTVPPEQIHQVIWGHYDEGTQVLWFSSSFSKNEKSKGSSYVHSVPVELSGAAKVRLDGQEMLKKGDLSYVSYKLERTMVAPRQTLAPYRLEYFTNDSQQFSFDIQIPSEIRAEVPTEFSKRDELVVFWRAPYETYKHVKISHDFRVPSDTCHITMPEDTSLSNASGKVMVRLQGSDCSQVREMSVQICNETTGDLGMHPGPTYIMGTYCAPKATIRVRD